MIEHYLYFRALSRGEAYSVSKCGLVFGSTSGNSSYPLLPTYTQGTLLVSSWNQESLVHFIFQFEFYYDIKSMFISFSLSFFIVRSISCKLKFWTVIKKIFFLLVPAWGILLWICEHFRLIWYNSGVPTLPIMPSSLFWPQPVVNQGICLQLYVIWKRRKLNIPSYHLSEQLS